MMKSGPSVTITVKTPVRDEVPLVAVNVTANVPGIDPATVRIGKRDCWPFKARLDGAMVALTPGGFATAERFTVPSNRP